MKSERHPNATHGRGLPQCWLLGDTITHARNISWDCFAIRYQNI